MNRLYYHAPIISGPVSRFWTACRVAIANATMPSIQNFIASRFRFVNHHYNYTPIVNGSFCQQHPDCLWVETVGKLCEFVVDSLTKVSPTQVGPSQVGFAQVSLAKFSLM